MGTRKNQSQSEGLDPKLSYRKIGLELKKGLPVTVDEKTRSIEVVGSTEQPVRTYDYRSGQEIDEILLMRGVELPKGRQVPLLDTHFRWDTASVLGSYREITPSGDQLLGRAYFSTVPEAEGPWTKVREGHLTDFSVGYLTMPSASVVIPAGEKATVKGREFTAGSDRPTVVRTRWRLKELSVVPIGADDRAKARNADINPKFESEIDTGDIKMNEEERFEEVRRANIQCLVDQLKPQGIDLKAYGARCIVDGTSWDDFREGCLKRMPKTEPVFTNDMNSDPIGIRSKEVEGFSLMRLVNSIANGNPEEAAHEHDICRHAAQVSGKQPKGVFVPYAALSGI